MSGIYETTIDIDPSDIEWKMELWKSEKSIHKRKDIGDNEYHCCIIF